MKVKVKKSSIHGYGLFAVQNLSKNVRIINYTGEIIKTKEADKRTLAYARQGHIWVFEYDKDYSIDAHVGGNISKYVNHSYHPNCYVECKDFNIWYRASRNILAGEELTIDYGEDYADGFFKIKK